MSASNQGVTLASIRRNIDDFGHHVNLVSQGVVPRNAYTIGLNSKLGFDFTIAGSSVFIQDQIFEIIESFVYISNYSPIEIGRAVEIDNYGKFLTRICDSSWVELICNGAVAIYGSPTCFLQIFPEGDNLTIDVPDLSQVWDAKKQPVWQWLKRPWHYRVPAASTATTNIAALRGSRITEAARWAEDEWEMFAGAGPDIPDEDIRIIPLSTLLGHDPSIADVMEVKIGEGIWRDKGEQSWHKWKSR